MPYRNLPSSTTVHDTLRLYEDPTASTLASYAGVRKCLDIACRPYLLEVCSCSVLFVRAGHLGLILTRPKHPLDFVEVLGRGSNRQ